MKKSTKIKRLKFSIIILVILILLIGILSAVLSTNGSGIVDNLKNLTAEVASGIVNDNTLDLPDSVKDTFNNYINSGNSSTSTSDNTSSDNSNISSELYKVVRVVDGDTLIIDYNGTEERVRLIGVDTPESVHPDKEKNTEFGTTASNFSKDLLTDKYVKIELDVQERDQYGRLLAYIYLDDVMVNKLLLQEGYAKVATYPPNVKYVDDFTAIQEEARNNKKGLWGLE